MITVDWIEHNMPDGHPMLEAIAPLQDWEKHGKSVTDLCRLFNSFGSDKARGHNYGIVYAEVLKRHSGAVTSLFELGLGTNNSDVPSNMGPNGKPGASLRAWREYYPNAHITGADVDARILFEEERIATYHVDQRDPESIKALWERVPEGKFQIMIDDGLHRYESNSTFLRGSLQRLEDDGTYIIEDIHMAESNLNRYRKLFGELEVKWAIVRPPYVSAQGKQDNCLAFVHH